MISKFRTLAVFAFIALPLIGVALIEEPQLARGIPVYDISASAEFAKRAAQGEPTVAIIADIPTEPAKTAKPAPSVPVVAVKTDPVPMLPEGTYRKIGNAQVWLCVDYQASLDSISKDKRPMLSLRNDCFPKTMEFDYRYVDRAFLWGPSLIETTPAVEHYTRLWVIESDLRKHSIGG